MEKTTDKFIVFVDTSYLTYMPAAEKVDWNILLTHAKACVENLDITPRVEVHISEISLREYRGKMKDDLVAKISRLEPRISDLQKEWHGNNLAKELEPPFLFEEDIFPKPEEIESAAGRVIKGMLDGGIQRVDMQEHHNDEVLEKYFNWKPPFDAPSDAEKDDRTVREKRRTHIPDAWILEAAIDKGKLTGAMLCLCKDNKLSSALEFHGHKAFQTAKDILDVLSPPKEKPPAPPGEPVGDESLAGDGKLSPLDEVLLKSINSTVRDIYLRILGYVSVLDSPSHEELVEAIAGNGFERKLIEACTVILSDKSESLVKDTGSHYIVGDKAVCTEAAERLTDEIIAMLGGE